MSGFLRVVGALLFLASILVWITLGSQIGGSFGFWSLFPQAVGGMVGGVLLAAFGTMLEDVRVMRYETEKQTKLLDQLANPPVQQTYSLPGQPTDLSAVTLTRRGN